MSASVADTSSAVEQGSKPRARIVFINRYFFPDVSATSQMLFDLAHRLVSSGYEVHVVCSRQRYDDPNADLPVEEIAQGVSTHRIRGSRFGRAHLFGRALDYFTFYLAAAVALWRVTRRGDILVAKTDPPLISIVAAVVAGLRQARLVNWLQDVFPEIALRLDANLLPAWVEATLMKARDWSLHAAKINVVLGDRMQRHFANRGIAVDSLCIVPNWASDTIVTVADSGVTRFREAHSLEGKFVAMYSGNLGRAHEYETILRAAEQLREEPAVVFAMIGGGALMASLRAEAVAKRLSNIVFIEYQPREVLAESLASADIHLACLLPAMEGLVLPSKFYGILAAARPIALIGDREGELAKIIAKHECGIVVSPGDGAALAHSLLRLREDPATRHAMGRRARELFDGNYTVDLALQRWLSILAHATRTAA